MKILVALSFLMLMGQQSCSTTMPKKTSNRSRSSSDKPQQNFTSYKGQNFPSSGSVNCRNPTTDFDCMMCACHLEAGNQGPQGKEAVVKVIVTRARMASFPKSVCSNWKMKKGSVCAFSPVCDGRKNTTVSGGSYQACFQPVMNGLNFQGHYASHFHTCGVRPKWRMDCQVFPGHDARNVCKGLASGQGGRLQDHVFYPICDIRTPAPGPRATSVVKLFQQGVSDAPYCSFL